MKKLIILALFASIGLNITACSKDDKDDKKDKNQQDNQGQFGPLSPSRIIKVVGEDGFLLQSAEVLVGSALDTPYKENFINTNINGEFAAPTEWNDAQPVTISAKGYMRTTFLGQSPNGQTLRVRKNLSTGKFELNGVTNGFSITNKDGIVDFALVMPALSKRDLFQFNVGMAVSPESDIIEIMGYKLDVPSNVSIPKQKETYILPVTLEKTSYRLYFTDTGAKRVFAARGQFPLKPVVEKLRNGSDFIDVINDFNITGGSLRDVSLNGAQTTYDIPVTDMSFQSKVTLQAPQMQADETLLIAALQQDQQAFYPTDIKQVGSKKSIALTSSGANPKAIVLFKKTAEVKPGPNMDRQSAAFIDLNQNAQTEFLPLLDQPRVQSYYVVQTPSISNATKLQPMGTYAALGYVTYRHIGQFNLEEMSPFWEVYSEDWVTSVEIPVWPNEGQNSGNLRWSVMYLAAPQGQQKVDLGPTLLENISHATQSSYNF